MALRRPSRLALQDLYIEELKDLFDAENRLVKALPKLAKASSSRELRAGFASNLEQTKGHVERLREIFNQLGEKPTGGKCAAMVGLIDKGEELLDQEFSDGVRDAALISAAQSVEHYEIAAYGCVKTWAGLLGHEDARSLLEATLSEEKATDQQLTALSQTINLEAHEEAGRTVKTRDDGKGARAKSRRASA